MSLDELKRVLTGIADQDPPFVVPWWTGGPQGEFSLETRENGIDWPQHALTMIGTGRLDHLQWCVDTILDEGVPGDLLEAGVWRGGACIFMRAVLAERGVTDRVVWVADSFKGFPPDVAKAEAWTSPEISFLSVPQQEVEANFARHGLLDSQVRFLPGYFGDSLPNAPVEQLALLRLDGDLYASTMDTLTYLYLKLSPGGFCIVDDWCLASCRRAVEDYRRARRITDPLVVIPGSKLDETDIAVYWRKS